MESTAEKKEKGASQRALKFLILEDNPNDAELIKHEIAHSGIQFTSQVVETEEAFKAVLHELSPDLILSDYDLPEYSGVQALSYSKKHCPDIPFILVTGAVTEDRAIEVLTSGAKDYVLKSRLSRLVPAVERALAEAEEHKAREKAERELRETHKTLESKISQRTAELQAEVEAKRQAESMLQRNNERLEILSYTARRLLESDQPQTIVEELCRRVMSFLDCQAFFNFLVNRDLGCLVLNAYSGIPPEAAEQIRRLDFGVAVCGCAARDACRIVVEDIPRTFDVRADLVKSFGIKAYACHPLIVEGKVIGTLSFGTKTRSVFNGDDLSMMKAITDQVAVAMSRVKMENQLRRLNMQLEQRVGERTSELNAAYLYSRSLIEASLDPLVTISPEGKIMDVNRATEDATGKPRRELVGTDFSDYFTNPECAREGYKKVLAAGEVRDYPLTIRHLSGRTTDVLYNAAVYRNQAGEVQGVFAAARDITDRKMAEEALEAERKRLYDLLYALPVYVILLTPDYHVNFANRYFEERFGKSHGRKCYEYLFDRTNPCENCQTYTIMETNAPHHWEWTGPDNRNYDIFDLPFTDADGSPMVMEVGIDITERKRAEEALRRSYGELEKRIEERTKELKERSFQLESANRELESFSYSVSHDLRAPLRAIEGFSSMLVQDLKGKLNPEETRNFNIVRDNARRMEHLINDLLGFARLGRHSISLSPIDMNSLVGQAWKECLAGEPVRRLELEVGVLPPALGDPSLIRQVVTNLLCNAVKYTRPKKSGYVQVGGQVNNGEAVYFIQDNGVGFDMKYYERLFGVFQRLHGSEFEGTGIGLAIVNRVIQRHGGRVWAEGKVGEGATFYFSLPVVEEWKRSA